MARRELLVATGICSAGLLVCYLAVNEHLAMAIGVAMLPLLLWLMFRPKVALIVLGVSIPFAASLAGAGTSLSIAASDVMLTLIFFVIVTDALVTKNPVVMNTLKRFSIPFA